MAETSRAPRHGRAVPLRSTRSSGPRHRREESRAARAPRVVRVVVAASIVSALSIGTAVASFADSSVPVPAGASVEMVRDGFQRTVASGLGSADLGGAYSVYTDPGVSVSVGSGRATVSGVGPGKSFQGQLLTPRASDVAASVVLTVPDNAANAAGFYYAVNLRRQGDHSMYRAKVKIAANLVGLRLAYIADGVDRTLASVDLPLRVQARDRLVIQAQAVGTAPTSLAVKAWTDGSTPPATWQLQYQDHTPTEITGAGSTGTWAYESTNGVTTGFAQSDLRVWSVGQTGAPSPAPSSSTSSRASSAPASTPSSAAPSKTQVSTSSSTAATSGAPASSISSSPTAAPSSSPSTSASPPPPPPAPAPAPNAQARGAAAVGSTAYVVPANALFVSPTSGDDAAPGTLAQPLRTVVAAVAKSSAGGTIVLRGGTYHESVTVPASKQNLTIQSYPGETAWFDGSSAVSGWQQSGSTWVHTGWNVQFDHSESFSAGVSSPNGWQFIGPQNPMAAWPDGMWLDGTQLTQVGSASAVVAGTFFADYANHQLIIGNDPTGYEVRASDLTQAFLVDAPGVTVQGLGVRRYATSLPLMGTVRMQGGSDTLRNVVVTQNATQGISFRGSDNLADHVTTSDNGMVGIHATTADGLVVRNSVISGNNAQLFNAEPAAAGIKVTKSRKLVFSNNLFSNNNATGLWFDQADVGFTIVNNSFVGNTIGAELELADTGIVANNVFDGGKFGLYLFDTGNVQVFNNSFTNNPTGSVFLSQDQRRQSDPYYYSIEGDPRFPRGDQTDPWLVRNVSIVNNLFIRSANGGMFQVYALDKKTNIPADKMNLTINGNKFSLRGSDKSQPSMVGWGGGDNVTVTRYETPAQLAAAKNSAWKNLQDAGIASVQAASSDDAAAVGLPAPVADAIGQQKGVKHIGPFTADWSESTVTITGNKKWGLSAIGVTQ